MKKRIALLYGGQSAEREVSVMGSEYVKDLLYKSGYEVLPVYINEQGNWILRNGDASVRVFPYRTDKGGVLLSQNGQKYPLDAAIPLLHGDGGESGEIQGLLKAAAIPFIGSDVCSGAICTDKHYTKCVAENLGIPVAKWVCFSGLTDAKVALRKCKSSLPFPLFIKPRRLGSSIGAHAVRNENEFLRAFEDASTKGDGLVIVEELFENKRELECAIYKVGQDRKISPPAEVISNGFYGYDEKYRIKTPTDIIANVNTSIAIEIKKYCIALTEALQLRHLSRIDFFLTDKGVIFNEVNTFPGFTEGSLYPRMLNAMGISPADALTAFIEDALAC